MIILLKGQILDMTQDSMILDVRDVGYEIHASSRTLGRIGAIGDTVTVQIYMHVREDTMQLFGFVDKTEKRWFHLLTTVQGVGAKVALGILSSIPCEELSHIIAAQDEKSMTRAQGVGKKMAGRIVQELKDKVASMPMQGSTAPVAIENSAIPSTENDNGLVQDAVSALVNLGYGRTDAFVAVNKAATEQDNLQSIIQAALKELSA